jgi:uncharacterized cupin superfamily protein
MVEEAGGWFKLNVRDAHWYGNEAFGKVCSFEHPDAPFPQTGVRLYLLEPGKPNCRYHRESAQEDVFVLSGRCKMLINGAEVALEAWDYVHLPPGVTHVTIGDGDAPSVVLMIGHRPGQHDLYYPRHEKARAVNAETPEPTPDPRVAYSDVGRRQKIEPPTWPLPPA